MTPSELKRHVEQTGSYFFTRNTMKFFGDTMANYGVRSAVVRTRYRGDGNGFDPAGREVEAWELYRKRPVKHGLDSSHYFNKETFNEVLGAEVIR